MEALLKTKNDELTIAQGLVHMFEQQQQQLRADLSRVVDAQQEFAASPDGRRSRGHSGDRTATADDSSDSGDDVGLASRQKLAEIESDMRNWDDQTKPQLHDIGARAQAGVPSLAQLEADVAGGDPFAGPRSASHHNFGEQAQSQVGSAAMSQSIGAGAAADAGASRRARNNATHRGNDVEFAAEISGQLLMEIKRLQALLAERDEAISQIERAKEGLDHELASLARERDLLKESSGKPSILLSKPRVEPALTRLHLDLQPNTRRISGTTRSRLRSSRPSSRRLSRPSTRPRLSGAGTARNSPQRARLSTRSGLRLRRSPPRSRRSRPSTRLTWPPCARTRQDSSARRMT